MKETDQLDAALRESSWGQTSGVPVGPDSSFAAAEIVLTAVDFRLREEITNLRAFRYIDDYEFACSTQSEAEQALGVFEAALGDFELAANTYKTEIVELPQALDATWANELNRLSVRDRDPSQTLRDAIALFSRASEFAGSNPGALKYALQKTRSIKVSADTWAPFQSLVWMAVSAEPTTIPVALDVLVSKIKEGHEIDERGASEAIEPLIHRNASLGLASEVAWGIWAASQLEVVLSSDAARSIRNLLTDPWVVSPVWEGWAQPAE